MKQLLKINSNYLFIRILTVVIFFTITWKTSAQRTNPSNPARIDSSLTSPQSPRPLLNPIPKQDTSGGVVIIADTVIIDTPIVDTSRIRRDSFSLKLSRDTMSAPVNYKAQDSAVVMIKSRKIYLYGKTETKYQDVTLTAPVVEIDQQTQILTAHNKRDSTGSVLEEAEFVQGDQGFTSDTIQYNFKTQRGIVTNTITESGEFFVHGEKAKKVSADVTFVKRGLFTTCNLDEPHFAFRANKLKVINKKLAISGPTHPEFEGVPLPIYLPFGYFPLSQGRHSGMLPPQFATNDQLGLGLEGLGYYKVINDYWDVKLYGNLYSYGSWSGNINPTYRKRYHYSGSFNFGLQKTRRNFKGDPDYYSNNSYTLTWSHTADNRARPGTTFSANVNASSTSYNRNVPNDPGLNFQNQLSSSIAYSKTWVDKPFNLTISANHNQNNQTGVVNLNLPDMSFTVSTLYPFQKKLAVGSKKWYEQLGVAYNGTFRNQFSFYDTAFTFKKLFDTAQWGAQHSIPITLSLPPILGGAVVVSPSISYSQVWVSQKMIRTWNPQEKKADTTTTKGLYVDQQVSFGLSFNTALYGTFQFKRSKIAAIRHVVRPSVSFSYKPDLSKKWFYSDITDTTGRTHRFSMLQTGGPTSGYGEGKSGGLTFQLDNNLEMKVRSKKDTADGGLKKVRLLDGFGFNFSYNLLADSFRMTPVGLYLRTNLLDKINLNVTGTLNPYKSDSLGQNIDRYAWEKGGKRSLGRVTDVGISLSTSFQSKPKDAEKDKQKKQDMNQQMNDPALAADRQRLLDYMRQNPSEFVDFNIPWQVSLSYSFYVSEAYDLNLGKFVRTSSSNANFNGSFNLTPKWNFSVSGYYNFDESKLQTFTMSISRDMHCWQMSINVTPVGPYRFFNITISPKSGILQDLKINRTRSFYTGY